MTLSSLSPGLEFWLATAMQSMVFTCALVCVWVVLDIYDNHFRR